MYIYKNENKFPLALHLNVNTLNRSFTSLNLQIHLHAGGCSAVFRSATSLVAVPLRHQVKVQVQVKDELIRFAASLFCVCLYIAGCHINITVPLTALDDSQPVSLNISSVIH